MPITAVPDHVAVAVPSIAAAGRRWVDDLRGVWLTGEFEGGGFTTRQARYANRGKLELLEPATSDGFAQGFLDRFGPRIHHVTLKVPDLRDALDTVAAAGLEAVDVSYAIATWHEAFLRPSQVGGLIVQLAHTPHSDADWARMAGLELPEPDPAAPALLGPTLAHPDLDDARRVWTTLGAQVSELPSGALEARWGDAPLTVQLVEGPAAGPVGLRFAPDPALPADDVHGPGTLPG